MITTIPYQSIKRCALYYNPSKKSMSQIQKEIGCQYMINAILFDMNTYDPSGYLTINNKIYCEKANPYGFALNGNKIVFSYANNVHYPDFAGCAFSVLVRDGKIAISESTSKQYGYTARSAVGIKKNGDVVFLCDKTNRSLYGIAGDLLSAGCDVALNYDGGGSSQCYCNGTKITSTRPVLVFLCIWTEDVSNDDTTSPETPQATSPLVFIDPGHSASEVQGSPDKTYYEHEFALDIGNRLKKILERHGVRVQMSRTDGSSVSLEDRAAMSNNANADLFVSLHSNAYGSTWSSPNGWEAYVVAKGGKAERLAESIRKYTIQTIKPVDRGVKTANYVVLSKTDAPAVLIEHGFHTNKSEVEKLKASSYRDLYAECNAKGILETLGIQYVQEDDSNNQTSPSNPDNPSVPWYQDAVDWVIKYGIADGTRPDDPAKRSEVYTMFMRLGNQLGLK